MRLRRRRKLTKHIWHLKQNLKNKDIMAEEINYDTVIASFMGWVEKKHGLWVNESDEYNDLEQHRKPKTYILGFSTSWDWLMPVVEKIESMSTEIDGYFGVYISSNGCTIQGTKFRPDINHEAYFTQEYAPTKLQATWVAVIYFIMWYNKVKDNERHFIFR
jgi:hypothetical protein